MSKSSLILTIEAHQPYVHHLAEGYEVENEWLFSAISDTYLPLLQLFSELESDGVPFRLAMVFSPTLCAMLNDPFLQDHYIQWLEKVILLGEQEAERYSEDSRRRLLAQRYLEDARRNYRDFTETYEKKILSKFAYYVLHGNIELLATAATHCYLPLFQDLREAINAQIEMGLISHRFFFNSIPSGFWLPEMGYAPGLEEFLRGYGFAYTVLDTHGLLFAEPPASQGVFAPVRCPNNFSVFGNDSSSRREICSETSGYVFNPVYRDPARDIGFESPAADIALFLAKNKIRMATGYKYWNRRPDGNGLYDATDASAQAYKDARDFLDKKVQKLSAAAVFMPGEVPLLTCYLPSALFGQRWHEGIVWLGALFRQAAERDDIDFTVYSSVVDRTGLAQKVTPFPSSSNGGGYGEDLLDSSNDWMYRYIKKNIERMVDLAERFPEDTGLKERALNLAAREVLLSMADDWPQMLHDKQCPDYARHRFEHAISAFTTVYDSLGSNFISTEWLTNQEKECMIFPQINYRIFRKKK